MVDLVGSLGSLQALLDDVWGVLELTKSDEVSSNEVKYLVIFEIALELKNVLHQIVAIRVLDQLMNAADDHISEGKLLGD